MRNKTQNNALKLERGCSYVVESDSYLTNTAYDLLSSELARVGAKAGVTFVLLDKGLRVARADKNPVGL